MAPRNWCALACYGEVGAVPVLPAVIVADSNIRVLCSCSYLG